MPISTPEVTTALRILNRPGYRGLRFSATPDPGSVAEQAADLYGKVLEALSTEGAGPEHIANETVFFRDVFGDAGDFQAARLRAYGTTDPRNTPPATFLQQPPCEGAHHCEIQILAILPDPGEATALEPLSGCPEGAGGVVFTSPGGRHLYLSGFQGSGAVDAFEGRTRAAFDSADRALTSTGFAFQDVVRTWIYVPDLEADYDTLNAVRSAFFEAQGIERIPASTGIQGAVHPDAIGAGIDLYALQPSDGVRVERMFSRTMNEAPSYGSRFARGMAVHEGDHTVAYLSGTASIDREGHVAHVGDVKRQLFRMFENFSGLMESVGLAPSTLQSARAYLKDRADLDLFRRTWRELGYPEDLPCNVVVADVCRPEWLCEVEGVAAGTAD